MTIIIIRVRCDHHHLCTMQSSWWQSWFVYDATIMMTIIIIRVRCDHHHLCTVLLSWFVYDAIIIDHHDLCTMWSSSFVYDAIIIILTPRIRLSCCCCSCCVTEKSHPYMMRSSSSNHHTVAWVTRPERPKGAKDEVKQARRAQSRPEGPPPRSRGPEGP